MEMFHLFFIDFDKLLSSRYSCLLDCFKEEIENWKNDQKAI